MSRWNDKFGNRYESCDDCNKIIYTHHIIYGISEQPCSCKKEKEE